MRWAYANLWYYVDVVWFDNFELIMRYANTRMLFRWILNEIV